jgi:hypothetical protein
VHHGTAKQQALPQSTCNQLYRQIVDGRIALCQLRIARAALADDSLKWKPGNLQRPWDETFDDVLFARQVPSPTRVKDMHQ